MDDLNNLRAERVKCFMDRTHDEFAQALKDEKDERGALAGPVASDVTPIRSEPHFPVERELAARLHDVIVEYEGRISLVATLGILELLKHEFLPHEDANG